MSRLNRLQKGVSQLTVGGLLLDGGLRLVQMGLADGGQFLAAFHSAIDSANVVPPDSSVATVLASSSRASS